MGLQRPPERERPSASPRGRPPVRGILNAPRIEWKRHVLGREPSPATSDSDLVLSIRGPEYNAEAFTAMLQLLRRCGRLYLPADTIESAEIRGYLERLPKDSEKRFELVRPGSGSLPYIVRRL